MTIKLPMNINLTIILPTYNEEENVAFLIPEIIEKFKLSNIILKEFGIEYDLNI